MVHKSPANRKRLLIGVGATAGVCLLLVILVVLFGGGQPDSNTAENKKQVSEDKRPDLARMSATWVLTAGGQLTVDADGEETSVRSIEGLPSESFVILSVVLEGVRGFTDSQLQTMCALSSIQTLNLRGTTVKDAHLESIARLTDLQVLNLSLAKQISDKGIAFLAPLQNLRELDLSFTSLSDAGASHLGSLTNLSYLDISLTSVSDASVPSLSKLRNLKVLRVRDSGISRMGRKQLEQALPGCRID